MNNASVHSNLCHNGKIVEMLGKIELNVSGLVGLRRETTELLNTTRTDIRSGTSNKKFLPSEVRQQEIIDSSTANQTELSICYVRDKVI